mgnify:CR=1 FL=1
MRCKSLGGVVMEKIKVEEIHKILKTILTPIQYVKLLELMLKDCELFTVQDEGKSSRWVQDVNKTS